MKKLIYAISFGKQDMLCVLPYRKPLYTVGRSVHEKISQIALRCDYKIFMAAVKIEVA